MLILWAVIIVRWNCKLHYNQMAAAVLNGFPFEAAVKACSEILPCCIQ